MVQSNTDLEIMAQLKQTEERENVKILLAVESGSRVWGFASPQSDYDVRFIYIHPADWYLSFDLEEKRDYIEFPISNKIDMYGWDIRKSLRLFWKSSPMFVEWILSPHKYIESGDFTKQARKLIPEVFSLESSIHNFKSIAKTDFHKYLIGEKVLLKKYFYVLRSLLSIRWIEKYGEVAPIEFEKTLTLIEDQTKVFSDIKSLIAKKQDVAELGFSEPIASIQLFIQEEFERISNLNLQKSSKQEAPVEKLNQLFRSILQETKKDC